MIGIDTNILARYLVQDDVRQSELATHFIEIECSPENPAVINGVVICELVWVLESCYDYSRIVIAPVIEKILTTRQFRILQLDIIRQALYGYKNEGADFADHYIAHMNKMSGCSYTLTFDKKAAKLDCFEHLV
jgi:predicted nucleic-acid-binding protein